MSYIHGDITHKCDFCGKTTEVSSFSSRPLFDITDKGWVYNLIEIHHMIPEKIIKDKYKGYQIIKEHKKIEKKIELKCDQCILNEQRLKKLKKLKINL